jgi:2-polyprenyl-6-hydroxyphenyl methylase/3-demethylubiquinone-9 3-methyltransferase
MRFGFGKNWEDYVKRNFSQERVQIAKNHLLKFLGVEDLHGKYFLDIGCGSGLHSLAALESGAARIVSFDFDPNSVSTTNLLRAHSGNPANWVVLQGSILDENFLKGLEPADVVYSWGVLHHTGAMWQAMNNTVPLLKPGGLLYIALYDYDIHVHPTPEFWLEVKQRYNRSGGLGKRQMELWYVWEFALYKRWTNLPALIKRVVGYKQSRGMAFYNDVVDWLGGWPMEFAKRADVEAWAERMGLDMLQMKTGEANTEYLFRRG